MTAKILNPFRPTRWEHHRDGRPLIWFTDTADELAGDKSVYVYGSRGSGKTTLIKGVCWDDLCYNESLKMQRKLADFPHIGVYIRFPDHIYASMSYDDWTGIFPDAPDPEYEYHRFFSLAVELICAERALDACHSLRLLNAMAYLPGQELRVVDDFVAEYAEIADFASARPKTFLDLARVLRSVVRRMNEACGRGTVRELVDRLPPREPYQLLSLLIERLNECVRVRTQFGERSTSFKFCLDDCEVLSRLQRKSLNTLVRLTRSPISWVVSSVGTAHDDSDTFIESQPLTDADRRVLSLDDRATTDFRQLCQSVVSLRLLFSMPSEKRTGLEQEDVAQFFNLDQRLGTRDVNDLMGLMVKRSTRPMARKLKIAAERLLKAIRKSDPKAAKRFDAKADRLPYYEAYILLHWRGREDAFRTSFSDAEVDKIESFGEVYSDHAFNSWLRRKQQNALLHFAASVRVRRIPYAGANVVVSMADGSIRDFLEIMGEIYEAYVAEHKWDTSDPSNFERFAASRTQVGGNIQTTGIFNASQSYVEGITQRSEIDSDVVSRLVHGLGYYTALLQSNPSDPRVFASAERGIFLIDYPGDEASRQAEKCAEAAVRQAELSGYLRPVETPRAIRSMQPGGISKSVAFRLHRRFAPFFRFSHRGAYEVVRVTGAEIGELCLRADAMSAFAWAKVMAGIAEKSSEPQISLPLAEVNSDG